MTSSRVAVTFVINNLDTNSKSIEGNIWSITKHFENPKSKFSGKKVIDEESKIINNNSAIVVFDMDSRELHHEGSDANEVYFADGQVTKLQQLMQETTTIKLEGVVFSNSSFNKAKMQVFARRFNVELDINNKPIQITGTWHAISQFREVLRTEISELCSNSASKAAVLLVEANENDITHSVANSTKGRLNVSSFSPDVLFLMQKCGVYQNDHLTYDTKGGCVIIECPADDEAASVIAEEFQSEYRQLMMSQKLKEYTFPILNISSNQQIEKLVSQFNADFNQSIFTYNEETKVIKCLSMSARQFNHIKAKVTELLQQSEPAAVNPTSKFTNSSEADTPSSMSITVTGGRKITLKHADIVEEAVDAIVNAANDKLQHAGGVALAINKASQGVVQVLSNAIIQKYNYIATGAAVHTAAGGALKCKYVIHTVGPEQRVHRNQTEHLLWSACISTLQVAEKLSVSSIAIPPISSGVFGVPKDVVAKTIVQAVCTYHVHTEGILQDVRIVIIDKETYLAFKPFFTNAKVVFDGNAVVTQPQSSALPHNLQQSHSKGQCSVCHKATTDQVMSICQHKYCRGCLAQLLHTSPCCVVCKKVLQQVTGNQPDGGKMSHKVHQSSSITGYEKHGTIIITYEFPKGVQGPDHPHYVRTYTAYLPNSPEGREVLTLLERAFDAKLIFTVGRSGAIIWSNIEHKTNLLGGPNQHGYPDSTYLKRVKEQLQQKGIFSVALV